MNWSRKTKIQKKKMTFFSPDFKYNAEYLFFWNCGKQILKKPRKTKQMLIIFIILKRVIIIVTVIYTVSIGRTQNFEPKFLGLTCTLQLTVYLPVCVLYLTKLSGSCLMEMSYLNIQL